MRSLTYEKNGLQVRRISVSEGTEKTARSPRGLNRPRRINAGAPGISSRPYTGSDIEYGTATCERENTSRGQARGSGRVSMVVAPGETVFSITSSEVGSALVTSVRR